MKHWIYLGAYFFFLAPLGFANSANQETVEFRAEVDQTEISADDTVTLRLIIKSDNDDEITLPSFSAPDFTLESESNQMSVEYQSGLGGFSVKKTQELIKILRPKKTGSLVLSKFIMGANDQILKAPPITIHVTTGAPIQKRRQNQAQAASVGSSVIFKAEVDKPRVFKGEQVVVSYTLLYQMKVFNLQVEKFPILSGFLREDLEMPIMGQRLNSQDVTINGVPYHSSLLAKYAAYPLQEGVLDVDSMALKFNYYGTNRDQGMGEDDPFFNFFQQLAPRVASKESEKIRIQVDPLPEEGKPSTFGGGVGKFKVQASLSRSSVRANEAVSLVVKVEGRGNLSSIEEPKLQWPDDVELYDTKVQLQKNKGGTEQKIFEFLLIPRVPGKVELPVLEMGFFDPDLKAYYLQKTEPIGLTVLDPAPGSALVPVKSSGKREPLKKMNSQSQQDTKSKTPVIRPLKSPAGSDAASMFPIWRFLYLACVASFIALSILILRDLLFKKPKFFRKKSNLDLGQKEWNQLTELSLRSDTAPWAEMVQGSEQLAQQILGSLESIYQREPGTFVRLWSREEVRRFLLDEQLISHEHWEPIGQALNFTDSVRFSASEGGPTEIKMRAQFVHQMKVVKEALRDLKAGSP